MLEYFKEDKVKELLNNGMKMINKTYFSYLVSLGKRGFQEVEWFLGEADKSLVDIFEEEVSSMKQELKRRKK